MTLATHMTKMKRLNLNDWSSSAYRLICFLYSNLRRVASYENYGINLKSCVGVWYSCTLFDVLTLLNPITACLGNKSSSFIVQVSDPRSNAYFIFSTFKWLNDTVYANIFPTYAIQFPVYANGFPTYVNHFPTYEIRYYVTEIEFLFRNGRVRLNFFSDHARQ